MRYLLLLVFGLMLSNVWAQFPPLEISADDETAPSLTLVDVPIRAGTNWQNIVNLGGTITFDTTVITYDQISFFGLSNPSGATFTYLGGGVLTYTWFSLISIGPTLNLGDIVFTIRFNAVGSVGDVSPVAFTFLPQNEYWNNGFGWSGGLSSTNGSVTITCPLVGGAFTSAVTGNTSCFTDATPAGNAWQWDFGDGNTSTLQNPCHTYAAPGNYNACLIVSDNCGNDTVCSNVYICGPPVADWTSNSIGLVESFSDATTNLPTTWLWDFGDGTTSTQQNPTHLYATEGTYTVCLSILNACGSDSTCYPVVVSCPPPSAVWTETSSGLSAVFTDQSTNAIAWQWDFGDGTSSSLQNPTHFYSAGGTYTVCQIATSQCGSDTTCHSVIIVCDAPATDWASAAQDLSVSFADLSSQGPTSWLWDFGDGNTSTVQSPSHTYAAAGTYTVCLTTTNACGSNMTCYTVDVVCDAPITDWSQTSQGFDVTFSDLSSQGATTWLWDFGDGNSSTMQNPTHTYSGLGTYLVCLTTTNACGSDSSCTNVVISDVSIFEESGFEVVLYPNPVNDQLTIELPNEQANIAIYDIHNRLIEMHTSKGEIAINTGKLSQGVYIVRISIGSNQMVRQFVKK